MPKIALVLLTVLFVAPAGARAGLTVSEPVQLAGGATGSSLAIVHDGTAIVAYGDDSGVHVREHSRPGEWTAPALIANSQRPLGSPLLAEGFGRPGAVVWSDGVTARLAPLTPLGPAETLPVGGSPAQSITLPDATVVTLLFTNDNVNGNSVLASVERAPTGEYSSGPFPLQRFVGMAQGGSSVVALGIGDQEQLLATERTAPGEWSAPVVIGDPQRPTSNVTLRGDAQGNLVVVMSSREPGSAPSTPTTVNTRVDVVRRPAGEAWQAAEPVSRGYGPALALSPSGVTATMWMTGAPELPFAAAAPGGPLVLGSDPIGPPPANLDAQFEIDDAARAAFVESSLFAGKRLTLNAGLLGCMSEAAQLGDPSGANVAFGFGLRGDGTGVLAWNQSPPSASRVGVYAVDVAPDGRGCGATAPPITSRPAEASLSKVTRAVGRGALTSTGLRATVQLGAPSQVRAVLSGLRAGTRVELATVVGQHPAGAHRLRLRVKPRRLRKVAPALRLKVTVKDDAGRTVAFRRGIRLKA